MGHCALGPELCHGRMLARKLWVTSQARRSSSLSKSTREALGFGVVRRSIATPERLKDDESGASPWRRQALREGFKYARARDTRSDAETAASQQPQRNIGTCVCVCARHGRLIHRPIPSLYQVDRT